jgi:hypothetical protein
LDFNLFFSQKATISPLKVTRSRSRGEKRFSRKQLKGCNWNLLKDKAIRARTTIN